MTENDRRFGADDTSDEVTVETTSVFRADFLNDLDAPAEETIVVPSSAGKLELRLSWSPEADSCGGDCEDCHEDCADHCEH